MNLKDAIKMCVIHSDIDQPHRLVVEHSAFYTIKCLCMAWHVCTVWQDAKTCRARNKKEDDGGGYLLCKNESTDAEFGTWVQDAKTYRARNKKEEDGGGYLLYNWDSAPWGVDLVLSQLVPEDKSYSESVRSPPEGLHHLCRVWANILSIHEVTNISKKYEDTSLKDVKLFKWVYRTLLESRGVVEAWLPRRTGGRLADH